MTTMLERWMQFVSRIGQGDGPALYTALEALYATPARAYHNLAHVGACLDSFRVMRSDAHDPVAVELALWLHDAVYLPKHTDNEERSAAVARVFARELGFAHARVVEVGELIRVTVHANKPLAGDRAVIADVDMSILGASAEDYDAYARAIRVEYSYANDADYRRGRTAFLRGLLERGAIFHTEHGRRVWEEAARANIGREIAGLERGAKI